MKNHYVYLTANLINGKQYVGDHTINPKEKKYYIGSGKVFLSAVKKYGECNFFKEILEWFDTREEAFNAQEGYIKEFNTLQPKGYNISPKGGLGVKGCHSEETKIKIGKSHKGKPNPHTKEQNEKIGIANKISLKGIKFSEEHKKKLKYTRTEEHKRKIGLSHKGISYSEESKRKMSLDRKGKSKSQNHKKKISLTLKEKYKIKNEILHNN